MDEWLKEAKADENLPKTGMYLMHNGVVRSTARALVREGAENTFPVKAMSFSADLEKIDTLREKVLSMDGIFYLRCWMNDGELQVGDDIMYVLVGGDTRPHVIFALQFFVGEVKNNYVEEIEIS